jgi:photosystem II stability/assembly factor-like uncharacterized protein
MIDVFPSRIGVALLCVVLLLGCPGAEHDASTDPEISWPAADLVAVDFVDEVHVVVAAATGEIHVSRDAGQSWQAADLPGAGSWRDIAMADSEFGWAVGDEIVLSTEDGGESWRKRDLPTRPSAIDPRSVAAIDRDRAVVIGADGRRLFTTDGGERWRAVRVDLDTTRPESARTRRVACAKGRRGRCWSAGTGIERSDDAGQTWQKIDVEARPPIDPIPFRDAQVDIARADVERIADLVAVDRPRSEIEWRLEARVSLTEIDGVGRRRDPDALFEVIAARIDEVRSLLENAGVPPERIGVVATPPWDYADYLDDDPHFLDRYWDERGAPASSVRIRVVETPDLVAICMGAEGRGFAVGREGALLRSDDAGMTWTTSPRMSRHDLLDVDIGSQRVVAVGAQGGLWTSADQGGSWQSVELVGSSPFFDSLRAVSFSPSGENGLIVGEHGRILRTLDGGRLWKPLSPGGP